jgi:hypothetical protein
MADPILSDEFMADLRDRGELICLCPDPLTEYIGLFRSWQCRRCFKALPRHTHQQGSHS